MRDFVKLNVWQKAHLLTISVYSETAGFPQSESFGLRAQLRGAAVSIEANIAEGSGRRTGRDFGRFLDIALGSANETECELRIARDLGLLGENSAARLITQTIEVRRMLLSLRSTLL
jgi:four helix bundle protein